MILTLQQIHYSRYAPAAVLYCLGTEEGNDSISYSTNILTRLFNPHTYFRIRCTLLKVQWSLFILHAHVIIQRVHYVCITCTDQSVAALYNMSIKTHHKVDLFHYVTIMHFTEETIAFFLPHPRRDTGNYYIFKCNQRYGMMAYTINTFF